MNISTSSTHVRRYVQKIEKVAPPQPEPMPLLCFNLTTKELRTSDVVSMCADGEESLGTTEIVHLEVPPTSLNRTLEIRFLAAQAEALKLGISLQITSGFRSRDLQAQLHANAVRKYGSEEEASKWVLPREVSHHPWGTAIDINYPGDPVADKWLEENGNLFGLCRVYENEWWHFEPTIAPGESCPPMLSNALGSLPSDESVNN